MFYQVAANTPARLGLLTYKSELALKTGDLVQIPLGKRVGQGVVVGLVAETSLDKIKEISEFYDENLALDPIEVEVYKWMERYYHYPLGKIVFDSLPQSKKRPRPLKVKELSGPQLALHPTKEQSDVIQNIVAQVNGFSAHLVHGVTGSGKSVVFLEVIKEIIAKGKSVIYMLPEINLTPQFIEFFEQTLGVPVHSYNSSITGSQKYQLWMRCKNLTRPEVFICVRSGVFLPVKNLGGILIDEEHDSSFKQDDRCPYHARDVAFIKAQKMKIPLILGSATPCLESYYHFSVKKADKTFYHRLESRLDNVSMPAIRIIDEKEDKEKSKDTWPFQMDSINVIEKALKNKEQVIVFINRLGFANFLQCRGCGHQFNCPNCAVNLKYFRKRRSLECPSCAYKIPSPESCPSCGSLTLIPKGYGTEKAQEVLSNYFKDFKVSRFDRDQLKNFKDMKETLDEFHQGKIDILVGTQMLSKGHNFKRVKKVIVLGIDHQLNFPDFRAKERAYQTLIQVAGRAGRYGQDGEVIVQTMSPEESCLHLVEGEQTPKFLDSEIKMREICHGPPFSRLVTLFFTYKSQKELSDFMCGELSLMMGQLQQKHFHEVQILGPSPASIEKRVNQYTWVVQLRSSNIKQLHQMVESIWLNNKSLAKYHAKVDVDPQGWQ